MPIHTTNRLLCRTLRVALVLHAISSLAVATEGATVVSPSSLLVQDSSSLQDSSFLPGRGPPAGQSLVGQVQNVLERQPAEEPITCVLPTGPIEATLCDFETIDSVNEELFENVHALVETPGFKYFNADLYRTCPFWPEEGMCTEASCSITSIDESEVPEKWRVAALSKVKPVAVDDSHKLEGCYYRDSDFCFLDDENEGEYYDLSQIPERYTGYSGGDAARVWRAIYQENCFGLTELDFSPTAGGTLDLDDEEKCLEKRVYYKVISGLHASISTHICDEMLDLNTGEWKPDLKCFIYRVASHPERLHNMYFNAVLLLRAVSRLEPYVFDYCSSGTAEDDAETRLRLERVMSIAHKVGKFEENALFRGNDAKMLKEEFKSHFRNVTRIMDCTGCDKCRLWGKVQSMGLATALKILFEMDEQALNPRADSNLLQRSEVVALMNTVHRISESLHMVHRFRRMWRGTSATESEEMVSQVEQGMVVEPLGFGQQTWGRAEGLARMVVICRERAWECTDKVKQAVRSLWATVKNNRSLEEL